MFNPLAKRNVNLGLIAALRLWLASPKSKAVEHDPDTIAIHARLSTLTERLDQSIHRLNRRLSSKLDRPHLAIVKKT